jgi:hypothetical protein
MIAVSRDYLNACCKDLLWISTPAGQADHSHNGCERFEVQFLHRTVYDVFGDNGDERNIGSICSKPFSWRRILAQSHDGLSEDFFSREGLHDESMYPFWRFREALSSFLPLMHTDTPEKQDVPRPLINGIDKLSCAYLHSFCDVSDPYHEESFLGVGLLQTLTSCQIYSCTIQWLQFMREKYEKLSSLRTVYRGLCERSEEPSLLLIALGLSEVRLFPVEDADENFVRKLLISGESPNMVARQPNNSLMFGDGGTSPHRPIDDQVMLRLPGSLTSLSDQYSSPSSPLSDPQTSGEDGLEGAMSSPADETMSIWELYLERWIKNVRSAQQENNPVSSDDISVSRNGWSIAKLLIQYGADMTVSSRPQNFGRFVDVADPRGEISALEALTFCVPSSLQSELAATIEGVKFQSDALKEQV